MIVVGVVACAGVGVVVLLGPDDAGEADNGPTDVATVGPMTVIINEAGEIQAEKRRPISNDLSWPVIIKDLVDEGTIVKEGQTIIEFECKELADAIVGQDITVTSAKNSHFQAAEDLKLKREELANKVKKAEQAVFDAKEDVKRYDDPGGEWNIKLNDAKKDISLAESELSLAQSRLAFKRKANDDPELNQPYSQNEIRAEELTVAKLKLSLETAQNVLNMLEKYDHAKELRRLKTAVSDAELDLKRSRLEEQTQIQILEAAEQAKKATLDMQENKLKEMREDERKLIVKAEKEGLVVYDTGGSWRWGRTTQVTVAIGEKISPRQQLMIIPDMTTLRVKTKVYEAMIAQVHKNLPAFIRLDARPDLVLKGHVAKVGVLPSSENQFWNPNVKIYNVIVEFDNPSDLVGLKPNMTAKVELILARLENVLSVPVAAVFTEQDETYCWREVKGGKEKVQVKVGRMTDTRVEILSGLKEGDRVLLSPSSEEISGQKGPNGGGEQAPAAGEGVKPPGPGAPDKPPAGMPRGKPTKDTGGGRRPKGAGGEGKRP